MALFLPATIPARDINGTVLGNAVWNFYHKQTLTPADTDLGDTVVADSNGSFAPITLETNVTYRAVLKDENGKVLYDIGAVLDNYFSAGVKRALDNNNRVLSVIVIVPAVTQMNPPTDEEQRIVVLAAIAVGS